MSRSQGLRHSGSTAVDNMQNVTQIWTCVRILACGTHGREMCTRFWWESPKEKDHSEDQGVDGMRMDLREIGWVGVDWI
jgi:hypothetical protein